MGMAPDHLHPVMVHEPGNHMFMSASGSGGISVRLQYCIRTFILCNNLMQRKFLKSPILLSIRL